WIAKVLWKDGRWKESRAMWKVRPGMKTMESSVAAEEGCAEGVFAARAACGWAQQAEEKQSSTVRYAAAIFICFECSKGKDELRGEAVRTAGGGKGKRGAKTRLPVRQVCAAAAGTA